MIMSVPVCAARSWRCTSKMERQTFRLLLQGNTSLTNPVNAGMPHSVKHIVMRMHTWTSGRVSEKSSRKPSSWSVAVALSHSLRGAERRAVATACLSSSHSKPNMAGCRCRMPKLLPNSSSASLLLSSSATQCKVSDSCLECVHMMRARVVHLGTTCGYVLGSADMSKTQTACYAVLWSYSTAGSRQPKQ